MDFIQPYLDYFSAHPDWAIAIIFLIAFGEALLIIGLFVPSTAVLVGAGVLVGTGHLPFWPVFLATVIGAIAGDQVSYWAGRLYGQKLKTLWPLNRYPQLVARGEDFMQRHGGKSIAIGRFVPGVKAVVPGIAGMFGMGQLYFASINFSSGIVWAAAHVIPGILVGQGLALAGELSGRLVFVLLILLLIVAVAGYLIRLAAAGLSPFLGHFLGRISAWAGARRSRSMRRFARAISPDNPRSLLIVLFAALCVTGLIAFTDIMFGIAARDTFLNADVSIFNLMKEMRNAPADEIMITLTMLGDSVVLIAMTLVMIAWLAWHRAYRAAIAAAIAIAAGKIFVPILKIFIQRPRPLDLYSGAETFSFPSGHATMSALIFGILAVLVSHSMGRWGRSLVYAVCSVIIIAIAYSRVYLGAHWFSDVLAGLIFGAVMTMAFAVVIEAIPPRRIKPLGLFGASFIAFIALGAGHVALDYEAAEESYAPPQRIVALGLAQLREQGWKQLPARRIDLVGRTGEVFAAQMTGSLDSIRLAMTRDGWTETPKWTWRQSIPYLNPNAVLADLPPRPALHEGLKAKLTLIRPLAGNAAVRQVLRAFKTDRMVSNRDRRDPVYLVSLTREVLRHGLNLYAVPSPNFAKPEETIGLLENFAMAPTLYVLATHEVEKHPQALLLSVR